MQEPSFSNERLCSFSSCFPAATITAQRERQSQALSRPPSLLRAAPRQHDEARGQKNNPHHPFLLAAMGFTVLLSTAIENWCVSGHALSFRIYGSPPKLVNLCEEAIVSLARLDAFLRSTANEDGIQSCISSPEAAPVRTSDIIRSAGRIRFLLMIRDTRLLLVATTGSSY